MTPVKLFHSSELNADSDARGDDHTFADGWYVCPFIAEGALIDKRTRGPFDNTADAFRMQARIEAGREW